MTPYSGLGTESLKGHPGAQGKELDFPQTPELSCDPPSPGYKPLPGGEVGACGWLCLVAERWGKGEPGPEASLHGLSSGPRPFF